MTTIQYDDNTQYRIGSSNMNSFAVVRADDIEKVRVALRDLVKYAHLTLCGKARRIEPAFADNILIHIMKSPLKVSCDAAAIVPLDNDASAAIGRLRKIHPPAHIIIISQRHDIYHELINYICILPEIEMDDQNIYECENITGAQQAEA